MKHLQFNEIDKDGKVVRKVVITQEQADIFNSNYKALEEQKDVRGLATAKRYELAKQKDDASKMVIINEKEIDKAEVIEAINSQEFEGVKKISANTGVVKVQLAFDGLDAEQKELVIIELDK